MHAIADGAGSTTDIGARIFRWNSLLIRKIMGLLVAGAPALGVLTPNAAALDMSGFMEGRVNKTARTTGLVPATAEELRTIGMAPVTRAVLPPMVDISSRFPTPLDQGEQQNCVAWAVGYAARSYYAVSASGASSSAQDVVSPAFVYNTLNRAQNGGANCQTSISIVAALNLLKARGAVPLTAMRYNSKDCLLQASPEALAAYGPKFRIRDYQQIDVGHIRFHLSRGNPVIFAMKLTKEFDTWDTDVFTRNGPFKSTVRDGREHAMVMTGYDNARQAYKFINSWSNEWGDGGFGWIDYRALEALWMEGWIISPGDVQTGDAPPVPEEPPRKMVALPPRAPVAAAELSLCTGPYAALTACMGNFA